MNSENVTLQNQAYEQLRQGIIFSKFRPGTKLIVKSLCDQLKMGRTPIREAIVRLQQEGLVKTVPQSGTYVSRINLKAAECSRFIREQLEMGVAVECCAKIREEDASYLNRIITLQKSAVLERNEGDFFISDNMFHQAFFEIAQRIRVWRWLNATNTDLERYRWLRIETEGLDWSTIMDQHYHIRDAILSHDPYEVRFLISLHLHMMFDEQARVITEFSEYFFNDETDTWPAMSHDQ